MCWHGQLLDLQTSSWGFSDLSTAQPAISSPPHDFRNHQAPWRMMGMSWSVVARFPVTLPASASNAFPMVGYWPPFVDSISGSSGTHSSTISPSKNHFLPLSLSSLLYSCAIFVPSTRSMRRNALFFAQYTITITAHISQRMLWRRQCVQRYS
jgi:hypothetical protein